MIQEINITTPAILFPAITLLMLAYTNRFLALSQLIRALHTNYQQSKLVKTLIQINHLRFRVFLIRLMQSLGVLALIGCTLSIISILFNQPKIGSIMFMLSVFIFLCSIVSSLIEIVLSTKALEVLLSDIENS